MFWQDTQHNTLLIVQFISSSSLIVVVLCKYCPQKYFLSTAFYGYLEDGRQQGPPKRQKLITNQHSVPRRV
jgi:hypothetical protein